MAQVQFIHFDLYRHLYTQIASFLFNKTVYFEFSILRPIVLKFSQRKLRQKSTDFYLLLSYLFSTDGVFKHSEHVFVNT